MPSLLDDPIDPPDKGSQRSSSQKSTSYRSTSSTHGGSRSGRHGSRSGSSYRKNNIAQQDAEHRPDRGPNDEWTFGNHERAPSVRDVSRSGRHRSRPASSKNEGKITQHDTENLASSKRDRSRSAGHSLDRLADKPSRVSAGGTRRHSATPRERGRSHRPRNTDEFKGPFEAKPRASIKPHRSPSRSSHISSKTAGGGPRRHSIAPPGGIWVPKPRGTRKCDRPISPFERERHRSHSQSSHKSGRAYMSHDTTNPPPPPLPGSSSKRRTESRSSRRSQNVISPEGVLSPAVSRPERPSSQRRTHSSGSHSRASHRSEDAVPQEETKPSPVPLHQRASSRHRTPSRASHRSEDIVPREKVTLPPDPQPKTSSQHRTHSRSSHRSENAVPLEEATLPTNGHPPGQRERSSRSLRRSEDNAPPEREISAHAAHNLSPTRGSGSVRSRSRPGVILRDDREEPPASSKAKNRREVRYKTLRPVTPGHAFKNGLHTILEEKPITGSHVARRGWGFSGDSESLSLEFKGIPRCVRQETPLREKTREEKMDLYQERMDDHSRRWLKSLCRNPKTGKQYWRWTP